jgi:NADH-quinone oxidoreductase subunit H
MQEFLKKIYDRIPLLQGIPLEFIYVFGILVVAVLLAIFVMIFAGVCTYIERKVAGHIQSRVGPHRVGPHGIFQWIADTVKLILKEDVVPMGADRLLFKLSPYIVFAGAFGAFVALPYTIGFSPASLNIGILFILAISSTVSVGLLMAGWASANKWSLLGAMRSAAQIVSYEVPIGLTILGMLLITGSLQMQVIVKGQSYGGPFNLGGSGWGILSWYIFRYPPFTILAFIVYFIAMLAETNRTPFDIPEAESELVAGYHVEYSGLRFAFFFLAEYAEMLLVCAIATSIFLGGYLPPFGDLWISDLIGLGWLKFFEGLFWFFAKTSLLVFVMMWLRWTLPRYRVDQLMELSWKRLMPIAFFNLFAIGILQWILQK